MLFYIIQDVLAVAKHLPQALIAFLAAWLILNLISGKLGMDRKEKRWRIFLMALLFSYLVFLFYITFFSRAPGTREGVDILPFSTMGNGVHGDAYVIENIFLFVPIGFLVPAIFHKFRNVILCAGTGMLLSIIIEVLQFFTKRGYAQTDDIIMNTAGMLFGYLMIQGIKKMVST